jgi:hypothetical protein
LSLKENALKEAKRVIEDTLFSSEGHFITASRWSKCHYYLGVPTVILAVISGSSAIAVYGSHYLVAGIPGIIAAVLAAVSTFVNPHERATCHLNAGNNYRQLRNEARLLSEIDYLKDTEDEFVKKVKKLAKRRDDLNQCSSQVPKWAHKKAKENIEDKETTQYAVDKNNKVDT